MGLLPGARTQTFVPGDTAPAAIINEIQDCIIGGKRKTYRRNIPLMLSWIDSANTWQQYAASGLDKRGVRSTAVAGVAVQSTAIDVPYEAGDRIEGLEIWSLSDGTASSKAALITLVADNANIVCSGTNTILTGAAKALYSVPAGGDVNHIMLAGERLTITIVASVSAGYIITCAQLIVSH